MADYNDPADYPFSAPLGQPATHEELAAAFKARIAARLRIAALKAEVARLREQNERQRALLREWLLDGGRPCEGDPCVTHYFRSSCSRNARTRAALSEDPPA